MSTQAHALGRVGLGMISISRSTLRLLGLLALLLVALVVSSHVSSYLFYAVATALVALLAYLSYRSPRVMLIAVVFMPIVDRYLVSLLIPTGELQSATHYTSEALLVLVTFTVALRGLRDGTLLPALRHPVVYLVAAFVAVAALSALVNGVPLVVAVAGIGFTVEASVLFVLPRVIGFTHRHAAVASIGFTAVATLVALLALGQVILHPDFLGLESFAGRFAEGQRVAAFLINPNMLGAVVAMGLPFPAIMAIRADGPRVRRLAVAVTFVLTLALLYSFSRGAWLGLGLAMLVVGLAVEVRALLLLLVVGALAYGSALVIPHHILVPGGGNGFDLRGATLGRLDALDSGSDLRVLFIQNATPIIRDHPLIGAGPGRYGGAVARDFGTPISDEYTDGAVPLGRTVDNFWLHALVEFGFLGAILLAGAFAVGIGQLLRAARGMRGLARAELGAFAAVAILLVVDSVAEMLLEGNTTSFTLWFFLGVGSAIVAAAAARSEASTLPAR